MNKRPVEASVLRRQSRPIIANLPTFRPLPVIAPLKRLYTLEILQDDQNKTEPVFKLGNFKIDSE
jgi:hypothetical protein